MKAMVNDRGAGVVGVVGARVVAGVVGAGVVGGVVGAVSGAVKGRPVVVPSVDLVGTGRSPATSARPQPIAVSTREPARMTRRQITSPVSPEPGDEVRFNGPEPPPPLLR